MSLNLPDAVLGTGKKKGYLTYDQVVVHLPEGDIPQEELNELLTGLEELGIDLIDAAQVKARESARRFREGVLKSRRAKLRSIRLCKRTPEARRKNRDSDLALDCGYIYLMRKGPDGPFKVGHTRISPEWRKMQLEKRTRSLFRVVASYATIVPFALEQALHLHLADYRVKRKDRQNGQRMYLRGELFWLPPAVVTTFKATAAKVEKWVLAAEEARMELELLRLKR